MKLVFMIVLGVFALALLAYVYPRFFVLTVLPFMTVVAGIALFDILRKERPP